jgi:hypothetical protein
MFFENRSKPKKKTMNTKNISMNIQTKFSNMNSNPNQNSWNKEARNIYKSYKDQQSSNQTQQLSNKVNNFVFECFNQPGKKA